MSNILKIAKVAALPGTLEASTLYMVPSTDTALVEFYVSDKTGTATRRIPNKADINGYISAALGGFNSAIVVANIAARNALALAVTTNVLVLDATGDTTVKSGAATYVFDKTTTTWYKISEAESLDVVLNWASILNKPSSAVGDIDDAVTKRHAHGSSIADIDDAVTKRHAHVNKATLDLLTNTGDQLYINGAPVRVPLETEAW